MTELLLIRHGRPVSGAFDPPLDSLGRTQATLLAQHLSGEPITAVVSSDLRRARETAARLGAELGVDPVELTGLREWGLPAESMEYVALELLGEDSPAARAIQEGRFMDFVPEQVDVLAFSEVVAATFDSILEQYEGERVAVVCHGGVINAYLSQLVGIPDIFWFHPEYTSVSRVDRRTGGRVVIGSLNEHHHLLVDTQ